jgi:hypothetical protein
MEEKYVSPTLKVAQNTFAASSLPGSAKVANVRSTRPTVFSSRSAGLPVAHGKAQVDCGTTELESTGMVSKSTSWSVKDVCVRGMSGLLRIRKSLRRMFLPLAPVMAGSLILAFASHAWAQPASTTAAISGQVVTPFGGPGASARVTICPVTASGIPCTPKSQIFSDYMLTNQLSNPISTDQYGNYKVFVTAGLYTVQIQLAGANQPTYIFPYAASASTGGGGGGGATFPNTPAVVVNTSTIASRNATFADIASLFTGTSPCFLNSDGTCSASTVSPGGVPSNAQFNLAGTLGGSLATFDAAGNFVPLSEGGTPQPLLAQTGGGNNGIQNSLQGSGDFAEVTGGYPTVEYPVVCGGIGVRVPFGCGGFGPPPAIAYDTGFMDFRPDNEGIFFYNPHMTTPMQYNKVIQDDAGLGGSISSISRSSNIVTAVTSTSNGLVPGQSITVSGVSDSTYNGTTLVASIISPTSFTYANTGSNGSSSGGSVATLGGGDTSLFDQTDYMIYCCGKLEELSTGIQTNKNSLTYNMFDMSQGISSLLELQATKTGMDDFQLINANITMGGGCITPSDECYEVFRSQDVQTSFPTVGKVASSLALGATFIPTQLIGGGEPGEGLAFVIPTQETAQMPVTAITNPSGSLGTITIPGTTFTPDIFGTTTQVVNTPQQYKGATTSEVLNLTGVTGAYTSTRSPTVCVSNGTNTESALVTSFGTFSGGSQSLTVNLRLAYSEPSPQNVITVTQGAQSCVGADPLANESGDAGPSAAVCPAAGAIIPCPVRTMIKIIGCPSAHVCDYTVPIQSGFSSFVWGAFTLANIPNTVTLTRTGGNLVTTSPFAAGNFPLQNDKLQITGCGDSSFNSAATGPITVLNIINTGTNTASWASTGSNTSTTCTSLQPLAANGYPANGVVFMPMYTVVQANNPTTRTPDTSFVIEANKAQVLSTDQFEVQSSNQILLTYDHMFTVIGSPTNAGNPEEFESFGAFGQMADGMIDFQISIEPPENSIVGLGGTRLGGAILFSLNDPGVYTSWISGSGFVNGGNMFFVANCGAYSCDDNTYKGWDVFQFPGGGTGLYASVWSPFNDTYTQGIVGFGTASQYVQTNNSFSLTTNATTAQNFTMGPDRITWDEDMSGVSISNFTYLPTSMTNVITNRTNGNTVTFSQTATAFTLTGVTGALAPTALDAGSTINGVSVPTVGTPPAGQAVCVKSAATATANLVLGQCSSAVSAGGACTCI